MASLLHSTIVHVKFHKNMANTVRNKWQNVGRRNGKTTILFFFFGFLTENDCDLFNEYINANRYKMSSYSNNYTFGNHFIKR